MNRPSSNPVLPLVALLSASCASLVPRDAFEAEELMYDMMVEMVADTPELVHIEGVSAESTIVDSFLDSELGEDVSVGDPRQDQELPHGAIFNPFTGVITISSLSYDIGAIQENCPVMGIFSWDELEDTMVYDHFYPSDRDLEMCYIELAHQSVSMAHEFVHRDFNATHSFALMSAGRTYNRKARAGNLSEEKERQLQQKIDNEKALDRAYIFDDAWGDTLDAKYLDTKDSAAIRIALVSDDYEDCKDSWDESAYRFALQLVTYSASYIKSQCSDNYNVGSDDYDECIDVVDQSAQDWYDFLADQNDVLRVEFDQACLDQSLSSH
jgi:hypothetical protein